MYADKGRDEKLLQSSATYGKADSVKLFWIMRVTAKLTATTDIQHLLHKHHY